MILTVTMNPSIDISYPLPTFELDTVNRITEVSKTAGGKGLNVTRVLHQMGEEVTATGILGGHHGEYVKEQLIQDNISSDFSSTVGETRNSIAILHAGQQTEILETGPTISPAEMIQFLEVFDSLLKKVDVVTLSGSLPKGLPVDFYNELIKKSNQYNVKVLLDTSGDSLKNSILAKEKPYLIKPNIEEISDIVGEGLSEDNLSRLKKELKSTTFDGIEWVVVTLGSNGALAKYKEQLYRVSIPFVEVINPVGSGDSAIAGFASAIIKKEMPEQVLKTGMTTGILNVMERQTGHIDYKKFDEIMNQIKVTEI